MTEPPSPHPLDFDWRYDAATARRLANRICNGPVLALGAPSVARHLESDGLDVTLVDRQPLQNVRRHVVSEVEDFDSLPRFREAIVDPPWYPEQLLNWSKVAARSVMIGGSVFVSVWPDDTRPRAAEELSFVLGEISGWAEIERNVEKLGYDEPRFEKLARKCADSSSLSHSPLHGELIKLNVNLTPEFEPIKTASRIWQRFTVDNYQLAVRLDKARTSVGIQTLPNADNWQWPFVSARASNLERVSIWSSEGEVGIVGDPLHIVKMLRTAFASNDKGSFESALAEVPELLNWRVPRPPYGRTIEWLHRQ